MRFGFRSSTLFFIRMIVFRDFLNIEISIRTNFTRTQKSLIKIEERKFFLSNTFRIIYLPLKVDTLRLRYQISHIR